MSDRLKYIRCVSEGADGGEIFCIKFRVGREVYRWYPSWVDLKEVVIEAAKYEQDSNKSKHLSMFRDLIRNLTEVIG